MNRKGTGRASAGKMLICLLAVLLAALLPAAVFASDDDNSLAALGITTEGVTVEPEFSYDIWEYTVTVPAGTTELALDPVPSNERATIADISGTQLAADGTGTVLITINAPNGAAHQYQLNVVSSGEAPAQQAQEVQTEAPQPPQTEAQTEPQTEKQTEDANLVKVDKNTVQEALDTIEGLKGEIVGYRDTISLYTKIIFGLIALAVILFFAVINLLLRKKDLKAELKEYRSLGYGSQKKGKKAKNGQNATPAAAQQQGRPAQGGPGPQGRPAGNAQQGFIGPAAGAAAGSTQARGQQPYYQPAQLDVQPQTSRKARHLPAYDDEMPGAKGQGSSVNAQNVPAAQENARAAQKEAAKAQKAAAQAQKEARREAAQAQKAEAQAQKEARREAAQAQKAEAQAQKAEAQAQKEAAKAQKAAAHQAQPSGTGTPSDADSDVRIDMIDL